MLKDYLLTLLENKHPFNKKNLIALVLEFINCSETVWSYCHFFTYIVLSGISKS